MAWIVRHKRGTTVTDITGAAREGTLAIAVDSTPVAQRLSMTLIDPPVTPQVGDQIHVLDGSTLRYVGWIGSIGFGDAGDVAGLRPTYALTLTDIYGLLRSVVITPAKNYKGTEAEGKERPAGYRAAVIEGRTPPKLDLAPKDMLGWALGVARAASTQLTTSLSASTTLVVNPTTLAPRANATGSKITMGAFRFDKWFPYIADGQTAYELIDQIAKLAALNWCLDVRYSSGTTPEFRLRTWDAVNPPSSGIELLDAPVGSVAAHSGFTQVRTRTLEATEDYADIKNRAIVSYRGKIDAQGRSPWVEFPNSKIPATDEVRVAALASQSTYGVRSIMVGTSYETAQMAMAWGRRALAGNTSPRVKGSARVPYDPDLLAIGGKQAWVRRSTSAGAPSWKTTITSVAVIFEATQTFEPSWLDLEFSNDPFDPPTYTPPSFVKRDSGGGGGGGKKDDTPPTEDAKSYLIPLSGTVYVIPLIEYTFTRAPYLNAYDRYEVAYVYEKSPFTRRFYPNSHVTGSNGLANRRRSAYKPSNGSTSGSMPYALGFSTGWTTDPGISHARIYIPWAPLSGGDMAPTAVAMSVMDKRPETLYGSESWNPDPASTSANTAKAVAYHAALTSGQIFTWEKTGDWSIGWVDVADKIAPNTASVDGTTMGRLGAWASIRPSAIANPKLATGGWSEISVGAGGFFADGSYLFQEQVYRLDPDDTRYVFDSYSGSPVRKQLTFDVADPATWLTAQVPFALVRIPDATDLPIPGHKLTQTLVGSGPFSLEAPAVSTSLTVTYDKTTLTRGVGYGWILDENGNVTSLFLLKPRGPHALRVTYEVA